MSPAGSNVARGLLFLSQVRRRWCPGLAQEGEAAVLRTNLLLAGTLVSGAGAALVGVYFTDFGHAASGGTNGRSAGLGLVGRF